MAKKVKFGFKNLYYSVVTDSGSAITYAAPVALPGAVSMSATPRTYDNPFEADDNEAFARFRGLQGYDITLDLTALPDTFLTSVLGQTANAPDGIVTEATTDVIKRVAILGERQVYTDGTASKELFAFLYCLPNVPNYEVETASGKTPKTVSLSLAADPHPYSGKTKVITADNTISATLSGWFAADAEWMA